MTAQERFEMLLRGQLPDRVPVVLMGFRPHGAAGRFATSGRIYDDIPVWPNDPGHDPSVERVLAYARGRTDLQLTWGPPPNAFWTALDAVRFEKQAMPSRVDGYELIRTVLHASAGDLVSEEYVSRSGLPPYLRRRFIQTEDDLRIFLSLPDRRVPVDPAPFHAFRRTLSDDAFFIVMPGFAPAAVLYDLIAPETFLMWSIERRHQLLEATERLAAQRQRLVRDLLDAGVGPVYQTLGHEDFIPPMMHPRDLEDFVLRFDRELCRTVHAKGGWVYCHCHGRLNAFLEQFADAGIDALHPLEPPPMGDTDLAEAKQRVGTRIVLSGNVQTHDLMTRRPEEIRALVRDVLRAAKTGGRFCLTPSAELVVSPSLSELLERNICAFIDAGLEFGRY